MKHIDVSQAAAAIQSGGVISATLQGRGGSFYIEFETRNGPAELVTTNAQKPRAFKNPLNALALVRELGLATGRFNINEWRPQDAEFERKARPDRSIALKAAHEAAAYNKWFRAQVQESLDDPRPGVPHAEVKAEWAKERAGLLKLAGKTK